MPPVQYRSQAMDHLGLVAGMCKELGTADPIDKRAPKISDEWNTSYGEAVVAMIINSLVSRASLSTCSPSSSPINPSTNRSETGLSQSI